MSSVIDIKDFSFSYNDKETLSNINLSIHEGQYVSIIGPNGAGKSTLLKCMNRILRGGRGSIQINGKVIESYSQKQIGKLIGYVSQSRAQAFPYTVYEFVLMGRYPHISPLSRTSPEDKRIVDEALDIIGITNLSDRQVRSLSGGEQQKVYLAGALAQQPKILFLDEPTTHLDPKFHTEIQHIISDVAKKNHMIVVHVTHDLNHIFFWSKQVIALNQGRIFFDGTPEEVLTQDNLKKIFNADFLLVDHPKKNIPIVIPEA